MTIFYLNVQTCGVPLAKWVLQLFLWRLWWTDTSFCFKISKKKVPIVFWVYKTRENVRWRPWRCWRWIMESTRRSCCANRRKRRRKCSLFSLSTFCFNKKTIEINIRILHGCNVKEPFCACIHVVKYIRGTIGIVLFYHQYRLCYVILLSPNCVRWWHLVHVCRGQECPGFCSPKTILLLKRCFPKNSCRF